MNHPTRRDVYAQTIVDWGEISPVDLAALRNLEQEAICYLDAPGIVGERAESYRRALVQAAVARRLFVDAVERWGGDR